MRCHAQSSNNPKAKEKKAVKSIWVSSTASCPAMLLMPPEIQETRFLAPEVNQVELQMHAGSRFPEISCWILDVEKSRHYDIA